MTRGTLNINADEVVKFTAKLESLSKNDLPRVIKKTLDKTALDVKQKTMPASARRNFTNRTKGFFKGNSRVDFAQRSRNISNIKSVVGFKSKKGGSLDKAVQELEQQEYGGRIKDKSFIPQKAARTSSNPKKNVRKAMRVSNRARFNIVRSRNQKGVSEAHRFTKAVIKAGNKGYVMNDSGAVFKITGLKRPRGQRQWNWKLQYLYSYKKNRSVKVSETSFMRTASLKSARGMSKTYVSEAKKQIDFKLSR